MSSIHIMWLLAYDGMQALDLTGPHEVFNTANRVLVEQGGGSYYELHIVSPREAAETESGLTVVTESLPAPQGRVNTLLIAGGDSAPTYRGHDNELVSWVREAGAGADRIACVCTGAFIAAEAGLLDNQQVTTHWRRAAMLAQRFPELTVQPDAIFINDDTVWTSAGVTAGIDLALALVESDCGVAVAQEVARMLVVFLRRAGGQSQFASSTWTRRSPGGPVRNAQDIIDRDPAAVTSLDGLATQVGMSSRQLARRFAAEVGLSPARYLEQVRVAAARQQLETTTDGLEVVATRCGFGTAETLRRTFQRHLDVTPDLYRKRFTTKGTISCK